MCETRATVHACAIGRGSRAEAKYWRCECGTVQPWKPQGQRFITANFEPMQAAANEPEKPSAAPVVDDPKPVAETVEDYTPEPEQTEQKPKKRGFFSKLLDEDE